MRTGRRWLWMTLAAAVLPGAAFGQSEEPRGFAHASVGFNVYTYLGASGKSPSASITPADKAMLFEQLGVGYWVHPHARLQLTGMLGETLSGLKPGASALTLAAVIPWAVLTEGPLFVGAGPLFAPRAFGVDDFHVGLFTCGGYGFRLGHGMTLAGAVQVPVMFLQRFSVAVTPAVILGDRF